MTTEEVIRTVALLLGESPCNMCSCGESGHATLRDRILAEVEPAAADVLLSAPADTLTGWVTLAESQVKEMEDGSVVLPLPDDFLLLHSVRLRGWQRGVTAVAGNGSATANLQNGSVAGVRGSASRPVGVATVADGKRALRLFGGHSLPAEIEEGWYLPAPLIADGALRFPARLLPALAREIAGRIRKGC